MAVRAGKSPYFPPKNFIRQKNINILCGAVCNRLLFSFLEL